jgi:hypothetical protein
LSESSDRIDGHESVSDAPEESLADTKADLHEEGRALSDTGQDLSERLAKQLKRGADDA